MKLYIYGFLKAKEEESLVTKDNLISIEFEITRSRMGRRVQGTLRETKIEILVIYTFLGLEIATSPEPREVNVWFN